MKIFKCNYLEPTTNPNSPLYYYSWRAKENISLSLAEFKKLNLFVNKLISNKSTVKFGDKVYLGKLSNLPRHKMKIYFEENNIHKTSRLNQSNTIILNKEYLTNLLNTLNPQQSHYSGFRLYKSYLISDNNLKSQLVPHIQHSYNSDIKVNGLPFGIFIRADDNLSIYPKLSSFLQNIPYEESYILNCYREKNTIDLIEYLKYIIENPDVNIIFDEDLLLNLNEDGIELDEEYLSTLDSMFESKSQDNINLALEMLSNVNIEKHSLTIALFLNKHKDKFSWGSGLSINNTSSFKSILKYFKSKNINFNSDWRMFSVNLLKLYKDNPEDIKVIQEFIHQNINMYLKGLGGEHLQVNDLSLALLK